LLTSTSIFQFGFGSGLDLINPLPSPMRDRCCMQYTLITETKMKNLYLIFFFTMSAIFLIVTNGMSQANKSFAVNLGLSAQGYGYPNRLYEQPQTNPTPTINLYGEYFLGKIFSLGFYGAYTYNYYKFHDYVYDDSYKDAWRGWDFGLRYTCHLSPIFIKNDKTDLYLAAFSGYTTRSFVYDKKNIYRDSLNYSIDALSIGAILGFRYFISKQIGVYGEAGLSRDIFLGAGVTYQIFKQGR
jgi:hypothetical protein